jgi:hypothetical protein
MPDQLHQPKVQSAIAIVGGTYTYRPQGHSQPFSAQLYTADGKVTGQRGHGHEPMAPGYTDRRDTALSGNGGHTLAVVLLGIKRMGNHFVSEVEHRNFEALLR